MIKKPWATKIKEGDHLLCIKPIALSDQRNEACGRVSFLIGDVVEVVSQDACFISVVDAMGRRTAFLRQSGPDMDFVYVGDHFKPLVEAEQVHSHLRSTGKTTMNDQRSVTDQLLTLIDMANRAGLYDAADFVRHHMRSKKAPSFETDNVIADVSRVVAREDNGFVKEGTLVKCIKGNDFFQKDGVYRVAGVCDGDGLRFITVRSGWGNYGSGFTFYLGTRAAFRENFIGKADIVGNFDDHFTVHSNLTGVDIAKRSRLVDEKPDKKETAKEHVKRAVKNVKKTTTNRKKKR